MLEAVWQGVVELGHGAVQAVQRDGWQQQQRRSGGGGSEEQEKLRSRADAGRTAIAGELPPAPARSLHHSARPVKKRTKERNLHYPITNSPQPLSSFPDSISVPVYIQ